MSTVVILAPVIISNWPVIVAAAAGAASALGFAAKQTVTEAVHQKQVQDTEQSVEIELDDSQVLAESVRTDQQIVLSKGTVQIIVRRDERGRCTVCAKGVGRSEVELRQIAEEFTERMTQCFVYNRVMSELKNKDFKIVNEEVDKDQNIRIHVRRWVD
jgi:ABC-type transporter MlaC component